MQVINNDYLQQFFLAVAVICSGEETGIIVRLWHTKE